MERDLGQIHVDSVQHHQFFPGGLWRMAKLQRGCELCEGVAALYCAADEAHICWTCDAKVHSANFLVARHTRFVLCDKCGSPTSWRASGTNPTPLTGLCASCSQGGSHVESQGECTTHDDGMGSRRKLCPTLAVARSVSGYESGCSTSNAKQCEGTVAEVETVQRQDSSVSEVVSEDVEGVSVDGGSVRVVSKLFKMKRLDSFSSGIVSQIKQISTRASEDVNTSVSHWQCDFADAPSWPATKARECNRCQSEATENSNRSIATVLRSSAQRQRRNGTALRGPSLPGALSASRLMRMLAKWHWTLNLSSPRTNPLAFRLFCKVSGFLSSSAGVHVTLAACLRLAAGFDEAQILVPEASEVAACAGVSIRRLAKTETHLLALLGWRRFPICT